MLSTRTELLEKLRLGEDSFLELKEVKFVGGKVRGPTQDDLADELAAFANTVGGVLLLGIDDATREVVGIPIERLDAVEDIVRQACADSVKPSLAPIIERITLPDSTDAEQPIIRVEVARSLFVHQSPSGYLHRVGSAKRPIPPDHLARLFQQRSQSRLIRFDESPVPRATLADMEERLWRRFAPTQNAEAAEIVLSKLAMAAQDQQGVWRPTVAGVLMACRQPERFLPGAFVQAVAYVGKDVVPKGEHIYQRDAQDITGTLDEQIRQTCAFVRKNMSVSAYKHNGGGRIDVPEYDMIAVFEAVTNAVAHRDYSMEGAKVRLRLFEDRLELYSPGMLPNSMTPESLPYRQVARNETLTSLLARCPLDDRELPTHRNFIMDKRGEGVNIILARSEELSGKRPQYRMNDDSELMLTIFAARKEQLA